VPESILVNVYGPMKALHFIIQGAKVVSAMHTPDWWLSSEPAISVSRKPIVHWGYHCEYLT
jgi:hypothetical protein